MTEHPEEVAKMFPAMLRRQVFAHPTLPERFVPGEGPALPAAWPLAGLALLVVGLWVLAVCLTDHSRLHRIGGRLDAAPAAGAAAAPGICSARFIPAGADAGVPMPAPGTDVRITTAAATAATVAHARPAGSAADGIVLDWPCATPLPAGPAQAEITEVRSLLRWMAPRWSGANGARR